MKNKTRILVVEGEPAILKLYSNTLRNEGHEVRTITDLHDPQTHVHVEATELALVSSNFNNGQGLDFCRQINAMSRPPGLFVVLLLDESGFTPNEVRDLGTHVDYLVPRPLDAKGLLDCLKASVHLRNLKASRVKAGGGSQIAHAQPKPSFAQTMLKPNDELYRQLAENIKEVFWVTDAAKNEMIYISPAYEEIWGRSCASLYESPRTWTDSIHPDDRERVLAAALTKQAAGEYTEFYRIVRLDNSIRWIRDHAFAIRDSAGEVYRIVGSAEDITRQKEVEQALRNSEARKGAIMEASLDAIITIDHHGRIIEFNSAAEKTFGCARSQAIGKQITSILVPKTLKEWFQRGLRRLFVTDEGPILGSRMEMAACRADGTSFPIEFVITRVELGGPPIFTAFIRDLTRPKKAEAQLARLAHAVESTGEPICITDLENRFVFVNRAFQQTYGYTEQEILGRNPEILFGPSNRPSLLAEIIEGTRAGGWRGELFDRKKNGVEFPIFLSTSQVRNSGGEVIGLMGVAQDITEQRRADEQIRLLAHAMQSTRELISITDSENRFTFVNSAFSETYGYPESEVLGSKPDFLYSRKNPTGLAEKIFQRTLAGGWRGELVNRKRDGTEFPISLSTALIRNDAGRILGLIGIARDISDRKRAEREAAAFSVLGHRLSAASTALTAAEITMDIATELFSCDAGYVHLYAETEDKILPILTVDTLDAQPAAVPAQNFTLEPSELMRRVMKEGPLVLNRNKESSVPQKLESFGDRNRLSASMMYVPIHSGARVIGVLSVQSYKPQSYSAVELNLLQTMADYCGDTFERIEVADALRKADAKYRGIFENATEGIFQTTVDGRYLSANPGLARMFGYSSAKELMSNVTNIECQTFASAENAGQLKRLLETQDSVQGFEAERFRRDGSRFWTSINVRVFRDSAGEVLHYEGTVQDITKRKSAEALIRESEEKFRALFESAPIAIALHDSNGKLVQTNRAYQRMTGYTNEELLSLGVKRITHPEDVAEGRQLFNELREGKRDRYAREKRFLHKAAHIVWAESFASVLRNPRGELTYIISMVEDISERRQAVEALRQSERKLRLIAENATEAIFSFDMERNPVYVNPAIEELTGYSLEEIKARKFVNWIHPDDQSRMMKLWEELYRGNGYKDVEFRLVTKAGQIKWCSSSWGPLFDEAGRQIGVQGLERDVTERKWAENLLQVQRDFGIFLSMTNDLSAAVERLLAIALNHEGLDCGAVYLLDPKSETMELAVQEGLPQRFLKRASRFLLEPAADRNLAPTKSKSRMLGSPMARMVKEFEREGVKAKELIPIQRSGRVLAVLAVASRSQAEVSSRTSRVLESLANQAGGAIARIRVERSFHANQELLEKTLYSLRTAVFVLHADKSIILECNPAATQIFGYPRELLIGQRFSLLQLDETKASQFQKHLNRSIKEKGFLGEFEFRLKRQDGTSVATELRITPLKDEAGHVTSWVSVVRDITDTKRVQEDLRHLSRHIIEAQETERLRVARELHDGVNQIIASAKMRLRKVGTTVSALGPAAVEILDRCDQLLVQALEENRRIAHNLRPSDLDALGLAAACRNYCRELEARANLLATCTIARKNPWPREIELNLFRIVQEAINNVEKHAHAKTVRLQITVQKKFIVLRIQDDGRGFEPAASRTAKRRGHGIGLTNMRERASALGGACEVQSTPGHGTTITVRVPCAQPEHSKAG